MARYQLFEDGKPHSHDVAFYENIETADHINQEQGGHRYRLMKTLEQLQELISPEDTVCDFGCGNGGLIREIQKVIPNKIWGYDLMPNNIADAKQKGNNNIFYCDFINDPTNIVEYPSIAICTEVLEHLISPDDFIIRLKNKGVKIILASSPFYETPTYHAPGHLWVFTEDSYKDMFTQSGWNVTSHIKDFFQYIIAVK
jgi:SAM-dependent methyltransferase